MRLGLFGGTFDPIHAGHLDVAAAARQALSLDEVVLLPASLPPHRSRPHVSAPHRFAMVAMAIQGHRGLRVSDLELQFEGPSYTAATIDRLVARGIPGAGLFVIAGADAFRDIASWKDYPALLDRCHFIVVSRPEAPAPELRRAMPGLRARMVDAPCEPGASPGLFLVDAHTAPVSSTTIRQRVARGEPIAGLVAPAVAAHIARHGLYRAGQSDPF